MIGDEDRKKHGKSHVSSEHEHEHEHDYDSTKANASENKSLEMRRLSALST